MSSEVKVKVSLQSGVQAGLTKIRGQFAHLKNDLGGSLGSLFAFGALTAGIKSVIDKGFELANMSKRFGVPVRELQRVTLAGKENGVETEDVARSWNKLALNQQHAIDGSDEMQKAFADLGLDMKEVASLPLDQLFYRIADSTATAEDRGKAYAAVVALMGRSSDALFSTLEMGAGKIKAVGDAMGTFSEEQVATFAEAKTESDLFFHYFEIGLAHSIIFLSHLFKSVGAAFSNLANDAQRQFALLVKVGKLIAQGRPLVAAIAFKEGVKENYKISQAEKEDSVKDIWSPKPKEPPKTARDREAADAKAAADAREAQEKKLQELKDKGEELDRKNENKELEGQAKINALIAQRIALEKEAGQTAPTDEEGRLALLNKAKEIQGEIIAAQEAAAKDLEAAQDRLTKAREDRSYAALKTDAERIAYLEKQAQRLQKQIIVAKDPKEKIDLQTQLEEALGKIQALDQKAPTITANSLRRIGGQETGGFSVTGIDDKLLREQTRHGKFLEEIAKNTAGKGGELVMR